MESADDDGQGFMLCVLYSAEILEVGAHLGK
jgi:hypothetical protein